MMARIGSAMSEQKKMAAFVDRQRNDHARILREIDQRHKNDVNKLLNKQVKQKTEMRAAFKVQMSKEQDSQIKEVSRRRAGHKKEVEVIENNQEQEFKKVQERESVRLQNYIQKQEFRLNELHARYQKAIAELQERFNELEEY